MSFLDEIQEFIAMLIAKIDHVIDFVIQGMPIAEELINQILILFNTLVNLLVDNRNKIEMVLVLIPLIPMVEVIYQFASSF